MSIQYCEIKNDSIRVITTNLGAHLLSVFVKEEDGQEKDVVLGYDKAEDSLKDDGCIGAVVGRVVNRVKDASFTLNGKTYEISKNFGEHHIHGGFSGFNKKCFEVKSVDDTSVIYHYTSPDGEEGFPGTLELDVTYAVREKTLDISFAATTDQDTIMNPTCHIYFNLSDEGGQVLDHELMMAADKYICVDDGGIPTGEFGDVEGTALDFRTLRRIGDGIDAPEVRGRGGYDHAFLFADQVGSDVKAELRDPASGRKVSIYTDLPAAQVYTANYLNVTGKNGVTYKKFGGVAIETQLMTDSIHIEKEPKVILRKGEEFHSKTSFVFSK